MRTSPTYISFLRLHHNKISNVQKLGLANIQMIDLNSNQVESLQFGQFAGLANLRIVDLSLNRLRSLPRDAFQVTFPKIFSLPLLCLLFVPPCEN